MNGSGRWTCSAMIALCLLSGCGPRKGSAERPVRFAIVPSGNAAGNRLIRQGAQKAARDWSKRTGLKIEIVFETPSGAAEQTQIIERLAQTDIDGMAVAPADASVAPALAAAARQTSLVCFERDLPDSGRSFFVASDDQEVGREIARQFIEGRFGEADGEVAILAGPQSSATPNRKRRIEATEIYLRERSRHRVLPPLYGDEDPESVTRRVRHLVGTHPRLRGLLLLVAGEALERDSVWRALQGARNVAIVAGDSPPLARAALAQGEALCLIGPRYFAWGERSVTLLEEMRNAERLEKGGLIDVGYDLIYRAPTPAQLGQARGNVSVYSRADYETQWRTWEKNAL